MTLAVGDVIVKLGVDGQPVTTEGYRKFKVIGTGTMFETVADGTRSVQIVKLEVIE